MSTMTLPTATRLSAWQRRVPILAYHSLDSSGSVVSVSPSEFARHVELVRDWGGTGISLRELTAGWRGDACLPPRPVVFTFDDALCSVLDEAAPHLAAAGFRATVFAVANRSGTFNDWPGQSADIPRFPTLSHGQLRQIAEKGFEIGAHGLTHAALDRLDDRSAEREIADSRRRLEDSLAAEVTSFAYPYGRASRRDRRIVAGHYEAACVSRLGFARPRHDRHWLSRIEMFYFRDPARFAWLPTWPVRPYVALRQLGREVRRLLRGRRGG